MSDRWIVRVQGKEYGPVDLEELREWQQEGRLIRDNEVREPESDRWIRAGELPEVFSDEQAEPPIKAEAPPLPRRTLGDIFAAGWRIYRAGFSRFFLLALFVSIPSFALQLAAPFLQWPKDHAAVSASVVAAAAVVFVALMALVIGWPFSIAATQLLAADLHAGRSPKLSDVLSRAKPLWTRMFTLGLLVYASYLLWAALPIVLGLSLAAGAPAASSLLLALVLLLFAAYMVARLFINFLFWQQAGALGLRPTIEALQESKELARSGKDRPRIERPLYRGALVASLWLLLLIALNAAIEVPVILLRLRGVSSVEQAANMMQTMATTNSVDLVSGLTTLLSCLVQTVLAPWLATIFVVLYLDTRATINASRDAPLAVASHSEK